MPLPGERGSLTSQQVCLRYVLKHPVGFRTYWVDRLFGIRHYHRYAWTSVVMAVSRGDTFLAAGRGSGKSRWVLEPAIVLAIINNPGAETVLTTFRKTHIVDRMERVIDYFERIPFFKLFYLRKVTRAPMYDVETHQGHHAYAASVGDDPEAKMIQGKHASTLFLDETQQYPTRAWMRLQGSKDPRGATVTMVGVPDGRLDTPFRRADEDYSSFRGRRFHISGRTDPFFDQRKKTDLIEQYQGEDTEAFKQEVDAKWGAPSYSAWNMDLIYGCMDEQSLPMLVTGSEDPWYHVDLPVRGNAYRAAGSVPEALGPQLPGPKWRRARTLIAVDPGYTERSDIGIFQQPEDGRWYLIARLRLEQKVEIDDQVGILDFLGKFYGAERIALDTTDGEGRDMARLLEKLPRWAPRDLPSGGGGQTSPIVRVNFNESEPITYLRDEEGEIVAMKDIVRQIGTRRLRELISARDIVMPKDESISHEFIQEIEVKGQDGVTRVVTPKTCVVAGQKVTTRRGYIPIEDVVVGDEVLTHTGLWRKVLGTASRQYSGVVWGIGRCNASRAWVTPDHLVLVRSIQRSRKAWGSGANRGSARVHTYETKPRWIRADAVRVGDLVMTPGGYQYVQNTEPAVFHIFDELGQPIGRRKETVTTSRMHVLPAKIEVDQNLARLFGLFLSEGSVGRDKKGRIRECHFSFHKKEQHLYRFVQTTLLNVFGLPSSLYERTNSVQVRCHSAYLGEALAREFGNNAQTKHIPNWLMNGPVELLAGVMRGLFQGDGGSIDVAGRQWTLRTVSETLARQAADALRRVGIQASVTVKPNKYEYSRLDAWSVRTLSTDFGRFLSTGKLDTFDDGLWLSVSQLPYPESDNDHKQAGVQATHVYEGLVYDLTVDRDHSFTVNGVIVHNCHVVDMLRVFAVMLFRENPPLPTLPPEENWEETADFGSWGDEPSAWAPQRDESLLGGY